MRVASRRVVTVAGQRFEWEREEVESRMGDVLPEAITSHYVVLGGRRYPPKQVIGELTRIDRADFTTHQARRILMGLGFVSGRQPRQALIEDAGVREDYVDPSVASPVRRGSDGVAIMSRPDVKTLQPFIGQWVATRGAQILFSDADPNVVVGWLASNRQRADSMFRVPATDFEVGGAAPL
jgi:hypothetical protein